MAKKAQPKPAPKVEAKTAADVIEEARSVGRPTDYHPSFPRQAEQLCALGATDDEIADFFGVSTRTIHRWKLLHEQFCHSVRMGKASCDERVERSLYQKSTGYYVKEQKAFKVKDGESERVEVVEVETYRDPDTQAIQFWLKNRKGQDWRDVKKHEVGGPGDFDSMTDDELRAFITGRTADASASEKGSGHSRGSSKAGRVLN